MSFMYVFNLSMGKPMNQPWMGMLPTAAGWLELRHMDRQVAGAVAMSEAEIAISAEVLPAVCVAVHIYIYIDVYRY